jgi:hypothetical protein
MTTTTTFRGRAGEQSFVLIPASYASVTAVSVNGAPLDAETEWTGNAVRIDLVEPLSGDPGELSEITVTLDR